MGNNSILVYVPTSGVGQNTDGNRDAALHAKTPSENGDSLHANAGYSGDGLCVEMKPVVYTVEDEVVDEVWFVILDR